MGWGGGKGEGVCGGAGGLSKFNSNMTHSMVYTDPLSDTYSSDSMLSCKAT